MFLGVLGVMGKDTNVRPTQELHRSPRVAMRVKVVHSFKASGVLDLRFKVKGLVFRVWV